MKRWFLLLWPALLCALSPDRLIEQVLQSHPQIAAQQQQIEIQRALAVQAGRLPNPMIEFEVEDPGGDEMQMVMLSQSWPLSGRLRHAHGESLALLDREHYALEQLERALVRQSRQAAVALTRAQAQLALIDRYLALATDLARSAAAGQRAADHRMQLRSDTLISSLLLEQTEWQLLKRQAQLDLRALTGQTVKRVDWPLEVGTLKPLEYYEARIDQHPALQGVQADQRRAEAALRGAQASRWPDVTTRIGLSRSEGMSDYLTLGVGVALPVYGREQAAIAAAQAASVQTQAQREDRHRLLASEVALAHARVLQAKERYRLIAKRQLPEVQHSYELRREEFFSGGVSMAALLEVVGQMIALEAAQIEAAANFHLARSVLNEWVGE